MTSHVFTPGEDGLYHCTQPGCEQPGYEHPQHLGLHLFHKHGIKGKSRTKDKPKINGVPDTPRRGRPRRDRVLSEANGLTAATICRTVLREVVGSGKISLEGMEAYLDWVAATDDFLLRLRLEG